MKLLKTGTRLTLSEESKHYIILFAFSFIILLFFTKSSPLFLLNDWVDANAFFTVGKGMANGLVPYRDLFEQKGPLLYLIYAITYLISNQSFFGGYVLEAVSLGISLVLFYKIARFYVPGIYALWVSCFFPFFLLYLPFFKMGGSAEEFAIPFLMSLILLIFYMDRNQEVQGRAFFVQGFCMGCVFWIKYTMIGAWIGFFLLIFFIKLFQRRFKELFFIILKSLAGFACAALPWLLYFGIHGALKDLYDVYFKINMTIYPSQQNIISGFFNSIMTAMRTFNDTTLLFVVLFGGFIFLIISRNFVRLNSTKCLLTAAFLFSGVVVYWGGITALPYYSLIIIPFCSVGLLAVVYLISRFRKETIISGNSRIVQTGLCLLFSFCIIFSVNNNFEQSRFFTESSTISFGDENQDTTRPAQYVFADIIMEKENPTLLNYDYLDHGVFTITGLLPSNRYFEKQNFEYSLYPENMDEQNQIISEKAVDFVVYRSEYNADLNELPVTVESRYDLLCQNYQIVAKHSQEVESRIYTYWLLEKKPA